MRTAFNVYNNINKIIVINNFVIFAFTLVIKCKIVRKNLILYAVNAKSLVISILLFISQNNCNIILIPDDV